MKFDEAQAAAIAHLDGPMMVLAGPGSGKTTVITHRIRRLLDQGADPSGILVITFTKAAAEEMKARFLALSAAEGDKTDGGRVTFGTFHSVFYRILRTAYRFPAGNVAGETEKRAFFREFLAGERFETEDEPEFIASVINEISYVKGNRIDPRYYYSQNCPEEWFKKLYDGYENWLIQSGKIDFEDILLMCAELFAERKDILSACQRKYRYILVDEFQDINRLQYEIVRLLALPENNLFIVGDDDQSVYRFRGAKPEIMLGFPKDYPDAGRILLNVNYRSCREIVECSLRLIAHNRKRFAKELVPARKGGRPADLRVYADPVAQAEDLARALRGYHEAGYAWDEMAVLFRTGMSPGLPAEKLMEYNVPFAVRDRIPDLYGHWIAKDIFAYLSLGAGSRKRSDFLRIINKPNRYLSRDAFDTPEISLEAVSAFYADRDWMEERIGRLDADLRTIGRLRPAAAVRYIRETAGYDGYLKSYAEFRRMDPEELTEIADRLAESAAGFATAREWMEHAARYEEELDRKSAGPSEGTADGPRVTLSTMHSAKGLEFPVVFLIDVNEGIIPHRRAAQPDDLEEERRLFYVALTRAKERLHICAVRERYHRKQEISRFVEECMGRSAQGQPEKAAGKRRNG